MNDDIFEFLDNDDDIGLFTSEEYKLISDFLRSNHAPVFNSTPYKIDFHYGWIYFKIWKRESKFKLSIVDHISKNRDEKSFVNIESLLSELKKSIDNIEGIFDDMNRSFCEEDLPDEYFEDDE